MQTFLERLESDNLDPDDVQYIEYLFDKIEDVTERLPWVPLEEYIEEVVECAIITGFVLGYQEICKC